MSREGYVKPHFPGDAFAGTAPYYARYRVPYPAALMQDMLLRAGVTGKGRLLDLACGPGRVALALIASFQEIWGIDLEPEMIAAAEQDAAKLGVKHIQWMVGKAEQLTAPAAWFELITIGEAFHRLDQQIIAEQTLRWLKPGSCVAIIGNRSVASDWESWHKIISQIVYKWTGRALSTGGVSAAHVPGGDTEDGERALQDTGFEDVGSYSFTEPNNWTIESIIGNLYSLSVCSRRVLGSDAEAFEADLKAGLLAHNPEGLYHETMCFGYTLGRKPV